MIDAIKNLNSRLWVFAIILISLVIIQALIFLRLALNFNKKNKLLDKNELKSAARTGTISVIGPAFSTAIICLSLISMVGSAIAFMRCGVIGAPSFELMMANIATDIAGVEFGSPGFTEAVLIFCLFTMSFASAPYFINTIITLKPLDKAIQKSKETNNEDESFMPYLANAAMIGIIGYMLMGHISSVAHFFAVVIAASCCFAILQYIGKTGKKALGDWNLAICALVGMLVGQVLINII